MAIYRCGRKKIYTANFIKRADRVSAESCNIWCFCLACSSLMYTNMVKFVLRAVHTRLASTVFNKSLHEHQNHLFNRRFII